MVVRGARNSNNAEKSATAIGVIDGGAWAGSWRAAREAEAESSAGAREAGGSSNISSSLLSLWAKDDVGDCAPMGDGGALNKGG